MSIHRYAARRDANEHELFDFARELGATIEPCGPLDGWVGRGGKWIPVECKAVKGRYTPHQVNFLARCRANNLPVFTWRTIDDVLQSLGATPPGEQP